MYACEDRNSVAFPLGRLTLSVVQLRFRTAANKKLFSNPLLYSLEHKVDGRACVGKGNIVYLCGVCYLQCRKRGVYPVFAASVARFVSRIVHLSVVQNDVMLYDVMNVIECPSNEPWLGCVFYLG